MSDSARVTRAITEDDVRAVQDTVRAHERSVLRRVLGLPVRGRVGQAIDRELERRGLVTADIDAKRERA